jgi:predicted secreted protein
MATNGNSIIIGKMVNGEFEAFAAVKSHDIQNQCDLIEKASASQQTYKEYVAGRAEWSVNVSYLVLQDANSNIEDLMKARQTYRICIKGRTGTYALYGDAICTMCKQSYQQGNLSVGSFALKGTGALTNTNI